MRQRRRRRTRTIAQQLLRWEKEDACAGLTSTQHRQLLEAMAELLISATRNGGTAPRRSQKQSSGGGTKDSEVADE
jgi:hypothetical protein